MDIVLLGMQGAGKGTQSRLLVEKYNLPLFETGAELRKLANAKSELGKKVKSIIEAGHLVPNEVVMEIIENFLKTVPRGQTIIFDGIPRSIDQANMFDALMKSHDRNYICSIITLSEESALKRLTSRKMCIMPDGKKEPARFDEASGKWLLANGKECPGKLETRKDDTPEAIKTRIETFKRETVPILEKYGTEGIRVIEIDGEPSVKEVTKKTLEKLTPLINK